MPETVHGPGKHDRRRRARRGLVAATAALSLTASMVVAVASPAYAAVCYAVSRNIVVDLPSVRLFVSSQMNAAVWQARNGSSVTNALVRQTGRGIRVFGSGDQGVSTDNGTIRSVLVCTTGSAGDTAGPPPGSNFVANVVDGSGGRWLATADGHVYASNGAHDWGSLAGVPLNYPIVGMASNGPYGYWLVASDGGVFAFGNAQFYGSTGDIHLRSPIMGISPTPSGRGYWLAAEDGGVFSFGDAGFHGSAADLPFERPVIYMYRCDAGYWIVGADAQAFSFDCPADTNPVHKGL